MATLPLPAEALIERFGKQAKSMLRSWGITRTEDVGEIVFSLVEANRLGKQPGDSREDFRDGYNFDEAFPEV